MSSTVKRFADKLVATALADDLPSHIEAIETTHATVKIRVKLKEPYTSPITNVG